MPSLESMTLIRRAVVLILTFAVVTGGCSSPSKTPNLESRRLSGSASGWNLLLLSVDTLRADRLGAYGYQLRPTSRTIDRLLESGVTFDRAVAPRALTWPSLTSVLTGLYPSGHGVLENGYTLPEDLITLPAVLRQTGYRTAAFLSNMCGANHQGWDTFACNGGRDGKTLEAVLAWAAELSAGPTDSDEAPFFLWVHLFGAHGPYYNGGDLATRELDPGYQGPVVGKKGWLDRVMTEPIELTPRDVYHLDALYDAAVLGTDALVARLLDGLKAAGLLEHTLVVFLSDHGEELYQHNRYLYHACSVYETTLHVPLGFSGPTGLAGGGRVPQAVELTDVAPTIYDLLGIPTPGELDGFSLVRYLERPGLGGPGKPAFSEYGTDPLRTILQGGWKLVDNPTNLQPYCLAGAPQGHYPLQPVELYNLEEDPGETVNLAAEQPERVAALRALIRDRFAHIRHRDAPEPEISPEMKRQLEALGYVAN